MFSQVSAYPWGGGYLWSHVLSRKVGISDTRSLPGVGMSREWVCPGGGYAWRWYVHVVGMPEMGTLDMELWDTVGKWVVCILSPCNLSPFYSNI